MLNLPNACLSYEDQFLNFECALLKWAIIIKQGSNKICLRIKEKRQNETDVLAGRWGARKDWVKRFQQFLLLVSK
jgi:hypothetical protein